MCLEKDSPKLKCVPEQTKPEGLEAEERLKESYFRLMEDQLWKKNRPHSTQSQTRGGVHSVAVLGLSTKSVSCESLDHTWEAGLHGGPGE